MYSISIKIGSVDKTFKKDFVSVEDNLLAVEHQVRQVAIHSNEKLLYDVKKHREMNEAYLKMFCDMFGNQFTVKELKQADMSVLETLNNLYLEALGGKKEATDDESEGKNQ